MINSKIPSWGQEQAGCYLLHRVTSEQITIWSKMSPYTFLLVWYDCELVAGKLRSTYCFLLAIGLEEPWWLKNTWLQEVTRTVGVICSLRDKSLNDWRVSGDSLASCHHSSCLVCLLLSKHFLWRELEVKGVRRHTIPNFPIYSSCKLFLSQI